MPDTIDPHDQKSTVPVRPERAELGVGPGIAVGCAVNLVLIILVPVLLLAIGILRGSSGKYLASVCLGVLLLANAGVVVVAHRRHEKGIVIGFAIAASLALLLGGLCWSSF